MEWINTIVTVMGSVLASGGLWTYLQRRDTRRSATTQLLLGLAHEKIIALGIAYIERGSMTKDEYEDLVKYLWGPYSKFGGNGLAEKVMNDVGRLPIYASYNPSIIPVEVRTSATNIEGRQK